MKAIFAIFLVYHIIYHAFHYLLSIKQNLSYAWLLGPSALNKLILHDIYLSIKQNLGYAWLPGPLALGKLILPNIYLSIKQNLGHAWLLEPRTLGKLISFSHPSNYQIEL